MACEIWSLTVPIWEYNLTRLWHFRFAFCICTEYNSCLYKGRLLCTYRNKSPWFHIVFSFCGHILEFYTHVSSGSCHLSLTYTFEVHTGCSRDVNELLFFPATIDFLESSMFSNNVYSFFWKNTHLLHQESLKVYHKKMFNLFLCCV